jgi:hypothetical protein
LLEANGGYAQMWALQQQEEAVEVEVERESAAAHAL